MNGISIKTPRGPNSPQRLGSGSRGNIHSPIDTGSPGGEIVTGTPISSVRAAVSLFGEVKSPRNRQILKKTNSSDEVSYVDTVYIMFHACNKHIGRWQCI